MDWYPVCFIVNIFFLSSDENRKPFEIRAGARLIFSRLRGNYRKNGFPVFFIYKNSMVDLSDTTPGGHETGNVNLDLSWKRSFQPIDSGHGPNLDFLAEPRNRSAETSGFGVNPEKKSKKKKLMLTFKSIKKHIERNTPGLVDAPKGKVFVKLLFIPNPWPKGSTTSSSSTGPGYYGPEFFDVFSCSEKFSTGIEKFITKYGEKDFFCPEFPLHQKINGIQISVTNDKFLVECIKSASNFIPCSSYNVKGYLFSAIVETLFNKYSLSERKREKILPSDGRLDLQWFEVIPYLELL